MSLCLCVSVSLCLPLCLSFPPFLPLSFCASVSLSLCVFHTRSPAQVLLLADDAPAEPVEIPPGLLDLLSTSYIRIYMEFATPRNATALSFFGATGVTPCP